MNEYILFRHNDLDGCGAGVVANVLLGEENVLQISCSNWNVDEKIVEYLDSINVVGIKKIFIVDLCPNKDTCQMIDDFIRDYSIDIVVYDHHVNECSIKYGWYDCTIESHTGRKECGTTLFYTNEVRNYPDSKAINLELIDSIRLYDNWEWRELENTFLPNQLNTILHMIGEDEFIKYYSDIENPLMPEKFEFMIEMKEREKEEYINRKLDNLENIKIHYASFYGDNYCTYAIVLSDYKMFSNDLMDKILDTFNIDFVMGVYNGGVSLRTKEENNIDVGEIAKLYGGGGRKCTAGFKDKEWYKWFE